jgi:hypothetical protein
VVLIAILILLAAATIALTLLAPKPAPTATGPSPDTPVAFGYETAWIAIRTRETGRVVELLGLEAPGPASWETGIAAIYDAHLAARHVFVSPPVAGWTFVAGLALPHPIGSRFADRCTPLLAALGRELLEVQYFFTCPDLDFYAWARVADGKLTRAFGWGDEGVIWNSGAVTREEKAIGLRFAGASGGPDAIPLEPPTEDHVIALAGHWGLDPTTLGEIDAAPGLGVLGRAPQHWRQAPRTAAPPPPPPAPRQRPQLRAVN